jgi:hypothetical protein
MRKPANSQESRSGEPHSATALARRQRREMSGQPLGDFSEFLRAVGELPGCGICCDRHRDFPGRAGEHPDLADEVLPAGDGPQPPLNAVPGMPPIPPALIRYDLSHQIEYRVVFAIAGGAGGESDLIDQGPHGLPESREFWAQLSRLNGRWTHSAGTRQEHARPVFLAW